jgi:hypothetical protein
LFTYTNNIEFCETLEVLERSRDVSKETDCGERTVSTLLDSFVRYRAQIDLRAIAEDYKGEDADGKRNNIICGEDDVLDAALNEDAEAKPIVSYLFSKRTADNVAADDLELEIDAAELPDPAVVALDARLELTDDDDAMTGMVRVGEEFSGGETDELIDLTTREPLRARKRRRVVPIIDEDDDDEQLLSASIVQRKTPETCGIKSTDKEIQTQLESPWSKAIDDLDVDLELDSYRS